MTVDTRRDRPDPNASLVKIFDTEHESEALVVKGLLDSVGGIIILVRAEDAEKARRIIAESQEGVA